MKFIEGGVCAAQGFTASGIHCGIRKNRDKRDLALIVSKKRAAAAAVYTQNLVKGAPLMVTKANIADGCASAILCNSGNANTCNADGEEVAQKMCALAADALGIPAADVVGRLHGVIGQRLDISPIAAGMEALVSGLSADALPAAEAILTTDTKVKSAAVEFSLGGKTAHLGGIAKGSGMIHPNMATMLGICDHGRGHFPADAAKGALGGRSDELQPHQRGRRHLTNDMCCVLANGMAENAEITSESADYAAFCAALHVVTHPALCRMIARDGEGATKLVECALTGAKTQEAAGRHFQGGDLLVAGQGGDVRLGRQLGPRALRHRLRGRGRGCRQSGRVFRSAAGRVSVCKSGAGVDFSEDEAKKVLLEDEVTIEVDLNDGAFSSVAWGCDLTYDYVKINGRLPHLTYIYARRHPHDQQCPARRDPRTGASPTSRQYNGEIVVIKYGGNAMVNEELKHAVMRDIVLLSLVGVKVVLLHGGGPEITEMLGRVGKESRFVGGLRVTDRETADIVQMVLSGKINKGLVNLLQSIGGRAVGLCGMDGGMIQARPLREELGYVGEIVRVDVRPILDVLERGYIPVVSTVGLRYGGQHLNINADTAAARIAGELGAACLVTMTDVAGILRDREDPRHAHPPIDLGDVPRLIETGVIAGGMIPRPVLHRSHPPAG